jgi:hypothetical protein
MKTMVTEMKQATREEWRELGFFYDYDEPGCCWRLVGSRNGLLRFADLLTSYAADAVNEQLSEHNHFGPYMYLKLITQNEREITDHAICGTLADFRNLSVLAQEIISSSAPGSTFSIGDEYAAETKSTIHFEVREDDFDPADADPLLSKDS